MEDSQRQGNDGSNSSANECVAILILMEDSQRPFIMKVMLIIFIGRNPYFNGR